MKTRRLNGSELGTKMTLSGLKFKIAKFSNLSKIPHFKKLFIFLNQKSCWDMVHMIWIQLTWCWKNFIAVGKFEFELEIFLSYFIGYINVSDRCCRQNMFVTVSAIFVTNIQHLFTLPSSTSIQKVSPHKTNFWVFQKNYFLDFHKLTLGHLRQLRVKIWPYCTAVRDLIVITE